MKKVAIYFSTLDELTEFESQIESTDYFTDRNELLINGTFTEREIELALNAYRARIVELNNLV
ncbi:MAG TPA: hypothetical protein VFS31_13475 [Chitinophagaceae bacterium]|nr:hypothetical protein [Chitinophagaceae bacterium]